MTTVRPTRLPNTAAKAGFDQMDPITQWFLGGTATSGADATGLNDDDRYGLDLLNVGTGGKALRATSGNSANQLKVDNTGVSITGLMVTGATTFSAAVTMLSTLAVAGAATFTGPATFVTAVVMQTTLNVSGGTVLHSSLVVTGPATFGTSVQVQGTFNADSNVNLGNSASDTVTAPGDATFGTNNTNTATFLGNVVANEGLTVNQSAKIVGNLSVTGESTFNSELNMNNAYIDFDIGNSGGFEVLVDTGGTDHINFDGTIQIKHDGNVKYIGYWSSSPH